MKLKPTRQARADAFDMVGTVGLALPDVEATTKAGSPVLKLGGCFMAGLATHPSAEPDTLVVRSGLEERQWLMEDAPETYYVTDYYRRWPLVLVRLARIDRDALRDVLSVSWRLTWPKTRKGSRVMRTTTVLIAAVAVLSGRLVAQEKKAVPKDSVRVSIPGCTKGYIFTAGRRTVDEPGSVSVPEGMHFRMNGPKKMMAEIKAQEGSMIEVTGITMKGQYLPGGVGLGGGVRVGPGSSGGSLGSPVAGQISIDVEGWRPVEGRCPSR